MYEKIIFSLFFCMFIIQSYSQIPPQALKRLSTTVLDQSIVTVHYQFTQEATREKTPVIVTDTTVLEIGNVYSVYYNWTSALRDSIYQVTASKSFEQMNNITVIKDWSQFESILLKTPTGIVNNQDEKRESTRIYKNRQTNIISSIDGTVTERFLVEEEIPPHEWVISTDTMTLLNYLCYKATTSFRGRNYTAWFAPDIPLNEGPWKIYGLPGLILHLEDENKLFIYEAIGLVGHTGRAITMDDYSYTKTTNENLLRWIENNRRNIAITVSSNRDVYVGQRINTLTFHRREVGD